MKAFREQECIPVGCLPSAVVAVRGDVSQHSLGWGVCVSQHALGRLGCIKACTGQGVCVCPGGAFPHTPPMDRITDACENITFPQSVVRLPISQNSLAWTLLVMTPLTDR